MLTPTMLRNTDIDGDGQADLENHGGPDQTVYAFRREYYRFYKNKWCRLRHNPLLPLSR